MTTSTEPGRGGGARASDGRRLAGRLSARLRRDEGGQELVESVFAFVLLIVLAFGAVEFGNLMAVKHETTSISREGANIASRGVEPDSALTIMLVNGSGLELGERGGAIVSLMEVQDGAVRIQTQRATAGMAGRSRIGGEGDVADIENPGFLEGQDLVAMEVLLDYRRLTPLGAFVEGLAMDTIYTRSIF